MDSEDEDELLHLLEPIPTVDENFIPPASVQDAYDYEREVYDSSLQFSPPKSGHKTGNGVGSNNHSVRQLPGKHPGTDPLPDSAEEDWSFIRPCTGLELGRALSASESPAHLRQPHPRREITEIASSPTRRAISAVGRAHTITTQETATSTWSVLDDSHEYKPLKPFVRSPFTPLVMDRCPVLGLSAQMFLRTCFRIGEMFQQGSKCHTQGLDAVIELFARVNFSSRESGTTKQHFQFLDLWNDRAPYPNGILASYKTTGLAESESRVFLSRQEKKMARVLGRLKRDKKNEAWWLQVINIRETDWEEIRWTKRIVSGDDLAKKVKGNELFA